MIINMIIVIIMHKYWLCRGPIWTGGVLNSLEGIRGGVWWYWVQFSLTTRMMLRVHRRPSGGEKEMCKEELHVGSSFASVCAASPLLNRCILLQSTLSPSSPTLLFWFSVFNSFYFPFLLTTPSGGRVRNYTTFDMFQVCLFETWRLSPNSRNLHKSVCVHAIHSFTYLKITIFSHY